MAENEPLKMTFDPNTIQHLGIKMYSQLPAAIAELVANAYDADAKKVYIRLYEKGNERKIIVSDDGHGMSFPEINNYFLKIGRNRRDEGLMRTPGGRAASGKKGLGKLALFGIGGKIEVVTGRKGNKESTHFALVWEDLKNWDRARGQDYMPTYEVASKGEDSQGTEITISDLKRKAGFSLYELAVSLSRMFNFLDDKFRVFLSLNDEEEVEITNDLKYKSLEEQFLWSFPDTGAFVDAEYPMHASISGKVITTKSPLRPGQRGITLFANGRLVNLPEFFGISESSIFFSYTTGWLNVNFVDEDNGEEDNISTNRQSLDWEKERTAPLRLFLQKTLAYIHKEWRTMRAAESKKEAEVSTGINTEKWLATVPSDKAEIINNAIEAISDPDTDKDYTEIIKTALHEIAPEYAALHWRYLHPEIHAIAEQPHHQTDYFKAVREAVLLYVQRVRDLSGIDSEEMHTVFNPGNGALMVTECSNQTEKNIQTGHQHLSTGVQIGCRNPITHNPEFQKHLIETGLYDEKVCLDMLALISHLFTRLDKAKKRPLVHSQV